VRQDGGEIPLWGTKFFDPVPWRPRLALARRGAARALHFAQLRRRQLNRRHPAKLAFEACSDAPAEEKFRHVIGLHVSNLALR
jgi:hypothetical protein